MPAQAQRQAIAADTSARPLLGLRFATSPAPAALIAHRHRTIAEIDAAKEREA